LNSHDRDYAVNNLGVSASRCRIVVNGIANELLDRDPEISQPADPGMLRIAQIGSYIGRKGVAYGAPALNSFLRKFPNVTVSFFGTGCDRDHVLADFDPDVHSRVSVRRSFVRSELVDLLDDHHVLLCPSLSEGFPLALGEAMARGLAPVASRIPGPDAIVEDEASGLLVPPANAPAIESALLRLIFDPDLLTRLRIGARRRAIQYTWASVAAQRIDLYREAAEWPRQSRYRSLFK
jgi:glycosyltransferase involved in cell wall biosynthesis